MGSFVSGRKNEVTITASYNPEAEADPLWSIHKDLCGSFFFKGLRTKRVKTTVIFYKNGSQNNLLNTLFDEELPCI